MEQGEARRRARKLGGLAVTARPKAGAKKGWKLGGLPSKDDVWIVVSMDRKTVLYDGTGHCPGCDHPWADHPEGGEGCQAQVMVGGNGPYDCNCQRES